MSHQPRRTKNQVKLTPKVHQGVCRVKDKLPIFRALPGSIEAYMSVLVCRIISSLSSSTGTGEANAFFFAFQISD